MSAYRSLLASLLFLPIFLSSTFASHSADFNGDGTVNQADLTTLIQQWQGTGAADLNHDGAITFADAGFLFSSWGTQVTGNQFYVAPNGSPSGNGSQSSPWDLATALAHPPAVKPGDTIWLRGGTYAVTSTLTSTLTGASGSPITVRQYPGERTILDAQGTAATQHLMIVEGAWTNFWGFEVTDSQLVRTSPTPAAFEVQGDNLKFINLVVHDSGQGFEPSQFAENAEIYGCLIFNHGLDTNEHGIYVQNNGVGTKRIIDNIVFNNSGYGIHGYSVQGLLNGFDIDGNTFFNNGIIQGTDVRKTNVFVGGVQHPAERVAIRRNYMYQTPDKKGLNVVLGWSVDGNIDAVVEDNYLVGGDVGINLNKTWQSMVVRQNVIYNVTFMASLPVGIETNDWQWDDNDYFGTRISPFRSQGVEMTFANWKAATGFDGTSRFTAARPTGVKVFVRGNQYEAGRANITVFNWDLNSSVAVDLSSVFPVGSAYEVRDAQNYFGPPVVSGTYSGGSITIPMNLTQIAQPIGGPTLSHTSPEFAAFVLIKK